MREFPLEIVSPTGVVFDGMAKRVIVRTICGDIGILAGHTDFVTVLKDGDVRILSADGETTAHVSGGMLTVTKDRTRIIVDKYTA